LAWCATGTTRTAIDVDHFAATTERISNDAQLGHSAKAASWTTLLRATRAWRAAVTLRTRTVATTARTRATWATAQTT